MSFDDAIRLHRDDHGFRVQLSNDWWGFRGPLGGYLGALLLGAATQTVADAERHPRSFAITFVSTPTEGEISLEPELIRVGQSVSTVTVRMHQSERVMAIAQGSFGRPIHTSIAFDRTTPPALPWPLENAPEIPPPFRSGFTPHFRQFEQRVAAGQIPFTSAEDAHLGGWLRLAEHRTVDYPLALTIADTWLPALMASVDRLFPVTTISLVVHFRRSLPLPDASGEDFVLVDSRTQLVEEGYFEEQTMLWSEDGRLLLEAHHLLIPPGGG